MHFPNYTRLKNIIDLQRHYIQLKSFYMFFDLKDDLEF